MLVLVEGADKNGKTTLAKALAKRLGWKYVHHGPPGREPRLEYLNQLRNILVAGPVVMDRSFIGEMVYGPMLRGRSGISGDDYLTLLRLAGRYGAVVVHASQDLETRKKWHEDDLTLKINWARNQAANREFNHLMDMTSRFIQVIKYDCATLAGRNRFVEGLVPVMLRRKYRSDAYLEQGFNGYGELDPRMILVGEAINERVSWANLPFDGGLSAHYLNDSLLKTELADVSAYVTNAYYRARPNDPQEIRWILDRSTRRISVIALGYKASVWLRANRIEHETIPHPQYWRRFRSTRRWDYVHKIEEALHASVHAHNR